MKIKKSEAWGAWLVSGLYDSATGEEHSFFLDRQGLSDINALSGFMLADEEHKEEEYHGTD